MLLQYLSHTEGTGSRPKTDRTKIALLRMTMSCFESVESLRYIDGQEYVGLESVMTSVVSYFYSQAPKPAQNKMETALVWAVLCCCSVCSRSAVGLISVIVV